MPSSPGYVRDYVQEAKTAKARGEKDGGHNGEDAERHLARRKALKLGMVKKGEDLDHRVPLSQGGSNNEDNWRARTVHGNRSFARNPDGSMKPGANNG